MCVDCYSLTNSPTRWTRRHPPISNPNNNNTIPQIPTPQRQGTRAPCLKTPRRANFLSKRSATYHALPRQRRTNHTTRRKQASSATASKAPCATSETPNSIVVCHSWRNTAVNTPVYRCPSPRPPARRQTRYRRRAASSPPPSSSPPPPPTNPPRRARRTP